MMGEAEVGEDRKVQLVRFLTMCLKERTDAFGMRPDREGFVSLMDLMGAILDEPDFSWVTVKDVEAAVESSTPRVFEIRGRRIRVLGGGQGRDGTAKRRRRTRKKKPRTAAASGGGKPAAERQASGDQPARKKKRRRRRRKKKPQADQAKSH